MYTSPVYFRFLQAFHHTPCIIFWLIQFIGYISVSMFIAFFLIMELLVLNVSPLKAFFITTQLSNMYWGHACAPCNMLLYLFLYWHICDAWQMLTGGGSHMCQLTAPAKQSALGHQLKGAAVLWKQ